MVVAQTRIAARAPLGGEPDWAVGGGDVGGV